MDIEQRLAALKLQVQQAALQANRKADTVHLIAVSKGQTAQAIRQAYVAGQRQFAENYLQEALLKMSQLADLKDIEWHFIGRIQSNKTKLIAENFAWVQSIDRLPIAQRLNAQRPAYLPPLNICLQLKLDQDERKGGTALAFLPKLVEDIACLPRVRLRGLMTVPANSHAEHTQHVFMQLRQAYDDLQQVGYPLDTLSMGMSADFALAILAGATQIRIGTALFGARQSNE